jgi:hypothetical protein
MYQFTWLTHIDQRVLKALFFGAVAAFLSSGIVFAATVTSTDLGSGLIKLGKQTYIDDSYVVIDVANTSIKKNSKNAAAIGDSSPGVEADDTLPSAQTALVKKNYRYDLKVREAAVDSWDAGDRFRVDVYSDDGSSVTLRGTLYLKQDTVDDAKVEGVKVGVETGYSSQIDDVWSVVVTRE